MKKILFILFFLACIFTYGQNCGAYYTNTINGLTVNFTDSSYSNFTNYTSYWDFGDSSYSNLLNPSHSFSQSGRYLVCLAIQDTLGCFDNFCDSITVSAPCLANFNYFIDSNNTVYFNNLSTPPPNTSYVWDFGDNSALDTTASPSHVYASANTYIVKLSLIGGNPTCFFIDTLYVNNCKAQFSTSVDTLGTATFINNSTNSNATKYTWDFGDNSVSNQKNPTHTYLVSGNYVAVLSLNDSLSNCFSSYTDTISVIIPPVCQAGFTYLVNGDSLTITNTGVNYTSILYDFGDSSFTTTANPIHIYTKSGTYIVCQTINDSTTNCNSIYCDTINIVIPPKCNAGFSYTINQQNVSFQNNAINFSSLKYTFGDGNSSTQSNPIHGYSTSGIYQVCQTVFNTASNCSDTFCDSVNVIAPASCQAGFIYITSGDSVLITNTATAFNRLVYYFGDGDSSLIENPVHLYSQSGNYIVQQIVYNDTTNCSNSFFDTLHVSVSQPCIAGYDIAIDTTKRNRLYLVNTSTNDLTHRYNWDFGDGNFATGRTPSHTYSNFGAYKICLTVSDSILKCTSTFCDSVGLDSNGNVLKANGYTLQVIDNVFIGLEEVSELEKIKIYPNPSTGYINVISNVNNLHYTLFGISGNAYNHGKIINLISKIEINNLPKGLYFLRLSNGESTIVKKLIKQ